MTAVPELQLTADTLLIIPCSGTKRSGNTSSNAVSLLSTIDPALSSELSDARDANRAAAQIDEKTLMPAYLRYSGELYKQCGESIGQAIDAGQRTLIVSGGYGLVLGDEAIGIYAMRFSRSDWPRQLLEKCILDFACREEIASVIAVMSTSTDYAKLIRNVDWRSASIEAMLVFPVARSRDGAQTKVPRAQGQIIASLISGGLDKSWCSSDQLPVHIEEL
jgi:hypothetical protein